MKTISYARVMGIRGRESLTPMGEPPLLHSPIVDSANETPKQAIRRAARKQHGINSKSSHWQLLASYAVNLDAKTRHRIGYDKVCVYAYLPETELRAHYGVKDECLDPFVLNPSWYLTKIDSTTHI